MAGWPHQLDGHEFEQALGVGDERESLAQKYISHSSVGQKPDIRVPAWSGTAGRPIPACRQSHAHCILMWQKD